MAPPFDVGTGVRLLDELGWPVAQQSPEESQSMVKRSFVGFGSKAELVTDQVRGRNVLHLGAVGETCQDTELRVQRAVNSTHALITRLAARCVGVDNDEPSVTALQERGVFDNLMLADVTTLSRDDIDLPSVDVVLAGDTIEHLNEPGRMLDVVNGLSDPGTQLVLTTPNAVGLNVFLKHLRGQQIEGPDHVCSFNAYSLGNLLERYGWQIAQLWSCYQPNAVELNPRAFRAGQAVFSRFPQLGGTLFVVCSRP